MNVLRICARYGWKIHTIIIKIIQLWLSTLFAKKHDASNINFTKANFTKADTILFLCAPAILRKYSFLASLKKKYSVKFAMLVHDLMPLTLKKELTTSSGLKNETGFFMKKSLNIIDKYLVATNALKNELHAHFQTFGKNVEISVIKFGFGGKNITEVPPMVDGKFILTVSTIEVRKNHITLVKAWHQLLKSNGLNSHKLVIVGKWGWKVEPLKRYLKENKELCEHVAILSNIDDNNLASLYKNCSFTVFPSIAEGYGLPVVESIYHGKVCIASNTPVMREVGGKYCDYFNTLDDIDLKNKLNYYINNPEILKETNDAVQNAQITSWRDATKHLFQVIKG
jgi:glycosyltransferase involved in cell wall biosynthesis